MATHYSANQYQSAFTPKQLQSWNVPKAYKERPSDHDGYTQFIANERGHLLPGVPRSQASGQTHSLRDSSEETQQEKAKQTSPSRPGSQTGQP
eukprot:XP_002941190.2 PREDICTED: protein Flattop [Xenopus tropicalis]